MASEPDVFGPEWTMVSPTEVPLAAVKNSSVVPISKGFVALMIATHAESRLNEGAPVGGILPLTKTQVVMTPDFARRVAANLIDAANAVSKTN